MAEIKKRERQPNFSAKEKLDLFSIINNKYGKIIENKLTDKVSMSEKELAWKNIEIEFNASSQTGLFRDQDCLKRFYENRKRDIRKLKARQRVELMKTRGGPGRKINFDVADEMLIELMNIKTIEGILNIYDSDEHFYVKSTDKDGTEGDDFQNKNPRTMSFEGSEDNTNTNLIKRFKKADDLTKRKDSALRPLYLSNEKPNSDMKNNLIIMEFEGNEYIQNFDLSLSEPNEDFVKPTDPPFLKDLPSTSTSIEVNNIENAGEQVNENLDTGTEKRKTKIYKNRIAANRPRPRRSGVQILASSHIAEKYDKLLDVRKILLEKQINIADQDYAFQKAKNKLELELLTLKVAREKSQKMDK